MLHSEYLQWPPKTSSLLHNTAYKFNTVSNTYHCGWVYVPSDCWTGWNVHGRCHIHTVFHLCVCEDDVSAWMCQDLHMYSVDTEEKAKQTWQLFNTHIKPDKILIRKSKGEVHPLTGCEGSKGKQTYSSTSSLTLVVDRGGWSMPHPSCFTPGNETPYPLYRRRGETQGCCGQVWDISLPAGFYPLTVQPLAICHTDYATPAHNFMKAFDNSNLYERDFHRKLCH
jgi:hypothetical protein